MRSEKKRHICRDVEQIWVALGQFFNLLHNVISVKKTFYMSYCLLDHSNIFIMYCSCSTQPAKQSVVETNILEIEKIKLIFELIVSKNVCRRKHFSS